MTKINQEGLQVIIKEQKRILLEELADEIIGSISDFEMEKLFASYFKKVGGMPPDINKLSVLFPIMEKAGMKKFVQAYVNVRDENPSAAEKVLDRIKVVLLKLKREDQLGDQQEEIN